MIFYTGNAAGDGEGVWHGTEHRLTAASHTSAHPVSVHTGISVKWGDDGRRYRLSQQPLPL